MYVSGLTDDKNDTTKIYNPASFKIKGIDKYMDAWYNLRADPAEGGQYAAHDIYGMPKFGEWKQGIQGNIIMDEQENQKSSDDIVNNTMQFLTQ